MRIAFAGTPAFAVPALEALAGSAHSLVGVLTQPDRPSGRGRKLTASAVKEAALALGLPVEQPQTLKTAEGRLALAHWKPDVLVVVAYGLILPSEALALPRLGCLNIHASLLPRWRGAAPVQRAILAGDTETGVTIMQMDAGLDTGPVLLERRTPIGDEETSDQLSARLAELGAAALLECLDQLATGKARATPQSAHGATYAAKLGKSQSPIDWSCDAVSIARQVRAFYPWPIAETPFDGEPLKILRARAERTESSANRDISGAIDSSMSQSGRILGVEGEAMRVQCAEGVLLVGQVQRPGRRPVLGREFAASAAATGKRLG